MRNLILAALLAVGLFRVGSIDPGTAKGTIAIRDGSIVLKHAYAFDCDNAEGMLDAPELRVLLSDRELPDDVIAGWNGTMRLLPLVRSGGVRGILLKINPAKAMEGLNATLLYPPSTPNASLLFISSSGNKELKSFQIANNRVVGELQYESKGGDENPAFKVAATFSAPVFSDQRITARLSGAAAVKSAPVVALLTFEKAIREDNLALAKSIVTSSKWSEIEAHRDQVGPPAFRAMVKQLIPSEIRRSRQIKQVIIREPRATILINDGPGKTAMSLVQVAGKWIVD